MDYQKFFAQQLDTLRDEGRYRVFADLARRRGEFPQATHHARDQENPVTVWCSNDSGRDQAVARPKHST